MELYVCSGPLSSALAPVTPLSSPRRRPTPVVRFGASLLPILPEEEVKEVLGEFAGLFHEARAEVQRKKLGLSQWEGDRDEDLVRGAVNTIFSSPAHPYPRLSTRSTQYMELLGLMAQSGADFTNTFRALSHVRGHGDPYSDGEQPQRKDSGEGEDSEEGDAPAVGPLRPVLHDAQYDASLAKQWEAWGARYQSRLAEEVHTAAQDEVRQRTAAGRGTRASHRLTLPLPRPGPPRGDAACQPQGTTSQPPSRASLLLQ